MALIASTSLIPFSPLLNAGTSINHRSLSSSSSAAASAALFRQFADTSLSAKRRAAVPAVKASAAEELTINLEKKASTGKKFPFSETAVIRPTNVYAPGRDWSSLDLGTLAAVAGMHGLALFAPFTFNWDAFWVFVELYVATGLLGITLSYHRNLSHRSVKIAKPLEYLFAYFGVQTLQGNPIDWVSTHRHHHRLCETERDPHTPTEGFWQAHFGWLFDSKTLDEKCGGRTNVQDLESQAYYRFLEKTYIFHPIALGALLYALGGFPYLVWGMGVRTCAVYHATWLVNSGGHIWGDRVWHTGDFSRNNWFNALITFGDGWHNNHHAFEFSARHGFEWWQFDMTWYFIKMLETLGLASDIKLPSEAQKEAKAIKKIPTAA